jgi:hypothetical protein
MTKEELVYAATLNLLGSDVPDPVEDRLTVDTVARLREAAEDSTRPHCPARQAWGLASEVAA